MDPSTDSSAPKTDPLEEATTTESGSSDGEPQNSNLFIGDLSKECTEEELLALFSSVAVVEEISIKRSKATKKPLGYGFVKMATPQGAKACLEQLQKASLCGRQIRIGWGEADCCCRVENLDTAATVDEIHEIFSAFGSLEVSRTEIHRQENGTSATLHFSSRVSAEAAKDEMHGKRFNGRLLRVEWAKPLKSSGSTRTVPVLKKRVEHKVMQDDGANTNGAGGAVVKTLSVNSVHVQFDADPGVSVTTESIQAIFAPFGTVTDVSIKNSITDKDTSANRGYAFVHFDASPAGRDAAIKASEEIVNVSINGLLLFAELSKMFRKSEHERQERHEWSDTTGKPPNSGGYLDQSPPMWSPYSAYASMEGFSPHHSPHQQYHGFSPPMQYSGYMQDPYSARSYSHSPPSPYGHLHSLPPPPAMMYQSQYGFTPSPVYHSHSPLYVYSPYTGVAHAVYGPPGQPSAQSQGQGQFRRQPGRTGNVRSSLRKMRDDVNLIPKDVSYETPLTDATN